jgi:hypothetical protein
MFFYNEQDTTIVTDGLTLHLDAGDTASYPGTGTYWYDLTGNHGTFRTSGVSFLTEGDNKYFLFGNNQGDKIYQSSSTVFAGSNIYTTEYWTKNVYDTPSGQSFYTLISYNIGSTNEVLHHRNAARRITVEHSAKYTGTDVYDNSTDKAEWHQLVIAVTSTNILYYVNGVLKTTIPRIENYTFRSAYFVFGQEQDSSGGGFQTSQDFVGSLSQIRVYKGKTLSAAEVLQNFNATKDRFGL